MNEPRYLDLLYGSTDEEFERAPVQEPQAMFQAHGRGDERPLFRLDPHWSGRIDLLLGSAPASEHGRQACLVSPEEFTRLFETAMARMWAVGREGATSCARAGLADGSSAAMERSSSVL